MSWGASLGSTQGKLYWCYTECTRWETLNNVGWERARKANPSQLVGHQEVRLPSSLGSGKVQPHSIRQIREMGLGEKKLEGRDWWEHGGKGQISWKEEPKKNENIDWNFQEKEGERQSLVQHSLCPWTPCNDMNDSLRSLYNLIISSNAFLLKVPAPRF